MKCAGGEYTASGYRFASASMNTYFDNAAACRPHDSAVRAFAGYLADHFANQEAAGAAGHRTAAAVRKAGERIARFLLPGGETFFCNTGTDALELAVCAHFASRPGTTAVTTGAEHPALSNALRRYAGKVLTVPLTRDGIPDPDRLKELLNSEKVSLFAIHHVNSETGRIQNIPFLSSLLRGQKIRFLLDTMQSAGKIPIPEGPDMVTVSGCKTGAPCGAALVFRNEGNFRKTLLAERNTEHRTGRCIPAACLTLADTLEYDFLHLEERAHHAELLKQTVLSGLKGTDAVETCPGASPYILHLLFPGKQGQILVRILESAGFSIAAGSACASETPEPSAVLRSMGYSREAAYSAVRLSFWDDLTAEDAENLALHLRKALKNY